jgi:hypothetical protein
MIKRLFDERQMSMRQERLLGVAMLVAGLAIAGLAVSRMGPEHALHAQAEDNKPAATTPGGTRPTTPAPEPARPNQNNEGATTGTAPASPRTGDRPPMTGTPLPPAPAEKVGPPLEKK